MREPEREKASSILQQGRRREGHRTAVRTPRRDRDRESPRGRLGHTPSWTRPRWTRWATSSEPKRRSPGVTVQQQHETRTGRDTTKTVVPNSLTVGFVSFQLKGNNLPSRSRAAWKKRLAGEEQVRSGDLRLSRPPRVFFPAGRSQRAAVTGGCQPRGAICECRHLSAPRYVTFQMVAY